MQQILKFTTLFSILICSATSLLVSAQTTQTTTETLTQAETQTLTVPSPQKQGDEASKSNTGLTVLKRKTQDHVDSIEVHRGEGKTVDYYDQDRSDQDIYRDGELGSSGQLRTWKLNK